MAHGRSYWEIPDELKAQVKRPAGDTLDDWEPALPTREAERREQVMQHAAANASTSSFPPGMVSLHERMAQAAQRRKENEMKKFTEEKQRDEDKSEAAQQASSSNTYLEMVRQLQHVDKETDSTGGKWLVR